jgi:hypothetical protein
MIISTSTTQNKEIISKESMKQFSESITIKQKRLGYFFNSLKECASNPLKKLTYRFVGGYLIVCSTRLAVSSTVLQKKYFAPPQ